MDQEKYDLIDGYEHDSDPKWQFWGFVSTALIAVAAWVGVYKLFSWLIYG